MWYVFLEVGYKQLTWEFHIKNLRYTIYSFKYSYKYFHNIVWKILINSLDIRNEKILQHKISINLHDMRNEKNISMEETLF